MSRFKASFYNRRIDHRGDVLLYNGKTGALFRLDADAAADAAGVLGPVRSLKAGVGYHEWKPTPFKLDEVPEGLRAIWDHLIDAGIFIPEDHEERQQLHDEFLSGRSLTPFMVTVTTTLDCNMRCYYCYQNDQQLNGMSLAVCDEIDAWVKTRLVEGGHSRMFLEWYGGEPMLNRDVIERLSGSLIPFCDERNIAYKSSMLCNGTRWPSDTDQFLARTRLARVQFSMDGPERFHNKRRGILNDSRPGRQASFDELMGTVEAVVGKTQVSMRINVDPMIGDSCLELVDVFAKRGWLEPGLRFYPYLAEINAMTEHCGFIGKSEKFASFKSEFASIKNTFFEMIARHQGRGTLEKSQFYPKRKLINCGAVNKNSVTFGPNGLMYKCGLEVGDHNRAHDALGKQGAAALASTKATLPSDRWDQYDPFTHASCKECQYLPVCLGGCPKSHMDKDEALIRSQSEMFEKNFESSVREYADAHA